MKDANGQTLGTPLDAAGTIWIPTAVPPGIVQFYSPDVPTLGGSVLVVYLTTDCSGQAYDSLAGGPYDPLRIYQTTPGNYVQVVQGAPVPVGPPTIFSAAILDGRNNCEVVSGIEVDGNFAAITFTPATLPFTAPVAFPLSLH